MIDNMHFFPPHICFFVFFQALTVASLEFAGGSDAYVNPALHFSKGNVHATLMQFEE